MKFILLSLLLFLIFVQVHSNDDEKLIRLIIKSQKEVELVQNFIQNNSELVDAWNPPMVDSKVLIQFTGNSLKEFSKLGVSFEVANNNITKLFEQSIEEQRKKRILREIMLITIGKDRFIESFDLDEYHSYDEIEEYLKNIAGKSSSTLGAKLISIGKSFENRNIYAMTISKEALVKKKILLLECTIHAREWISTAGCLKMINKFVIEQDETAKQILNRFDVHIVPILNPDGYEYSRNRDRAWRKNRGRNFFPLCRGADLNRNFDVAFGTVGVNKNNPCSLIYCGKSAFSEKETQAFRDYILSIKDSLGAYVGFHSFSQLLMYPYGYSSNLPKSNDKLKKLATLAQQAIKSKQGEDYRIGNIYSAIYPASGSSLDWVMLNTNCELVFIFEMRDTGKHGFILPEELIEPSFQDVWIGLEQIIINS